MMPRDIVWTQPEPGHAWARSQALRAPDGTKVRAIKRVTGEPAPMWGRYAIPKGKYEALNGKDGYWRCQDELEFLVQLVPYEVWGVPATVTEGSSDAPR